MAGAAYDGSLPADVSASVSTDVPHYTESYHLFQYSKPDESLSSQCNYRRDTDVYKGCIQPMSLENIRNI